MFVSDTVVTAVILDTTFTYNQLSASADQIEKSFVREHMQLIFVPRLEHFQIQINYLVYI